MIIFPNMDGVEESTECVLRPGRVREREPMPVIEPTIPSEGVACYVYGTVHKDEAAPPDTRYTIWHQAIIGGGFGDAVCRSVSPDGITWTREILSDGGEIAAPIPDARGVEFMESPAPWEKAFDGPNNIATCLHDPVVFPPSCRGPHEGLYRMFGFTGEGYVLGMSGDGRRFRFVKESPVIPLMTHRNETTRKTWYSDVGIPFRDDGRDRYVGLIKTYELDGEGRTRRCIGFTESPDLIEWSPVRTIWRPDEAIDAIARSGCFSWADFYGMPAFEYAGGYLGLLWLFRIQSELPRGTNLGKIQVHVAWSRDAEHWELVSNEPLVPSSIDGVRGCGGVHTASAPVREADHERIYLGTADWAHGSYETTVGPLGRHKTSVCLVTLPKDGFCRLWAADGSFTARVPEGSRRAEITTSRDEWCAASCVEVREAGGRGSVLFEGSAVEGGTVIVDLPEGTGAIRIILREAGVYSVKFIDAEGFARDSKTAYNTEQ